MRSFIIITVLSALAACYGTAVPSKVDEMTPIFTRTYTYPDLTNKTMSLDDEDLPPIVTLFEEEHFVPAVPGKVQTLLVVYEETEHKIAITHLHVSLFAIPRHMLRTTSEFGASVYIESQVGDPIHAIVKVSGRVYD